MDDEKIRQELERLGKALSQGDVKTVASCWELPALVLSDEGAIAVSTMEEIERFFAGSVEAYRARGVVATRPIVERVQRISARVSSVDVRWPALDAAGAEQWSERSHYILRSGDDGTPRIRVAMTLAP